MLIEIDQLAKLDLKSGDRVILTIPGRMAPQGMERLREVWKKFAPDVTMAILEEGIKVTVLSVAADEPMVTAC